MPNEPTPPAVAGFGRIVRSGQSDDGSVLVLPIERSYRIRTGELDPV